ncbi:hypothetical protein PMIN02_006369 [Paraphaeosphaeria minitans]
MASDTTPVGSAHPVIAPANTINSQLSSSLNNLSLQSPPGMNASFASANSTTAWIPDAQTNSEDSGSNSGGQPVNNGTGAQTIFLPIEERSDSGETAGIMAMQTITRDPRFSDFSLEELRLVDYTQGRKPIGAGTTSSGFSHWNLSSLSNRARVLHMLKGSSINIVVGSNTATFGKQETWCLPKDMISYHSLFFKAACSHDFKEKDEHRIILEHEDPRVFSLFVEWMIYNKCSLSSSCMFNAHLKAWVLGDKLLSAAFKNHAMKRLYDAHQIDDSSTSFVTTSMVSFVCENTCEGAKLRQFYVDFVVTHFSNPYKVLGTIEEWDNVLLDFDDMRIALFTAMRSSDQLDRVEELDFYLE